VTGKETAGERGKLFRNDGTGRFTDVTAQAGDLAKLLGTATCAACGDIAHDGRLDLVAGCLRGRTATYATWVTASSRTPPRRWACTSRSATRRPSAWWIPGQRRNCWPCTTTQSKICATESIPAARPGGSLYNGRSHYPRWTEHAAAGPFQPAAEPPGSRHRRSPTRPNRPRSTGAASRRKKLWLRPVRIRRRRTPPSVSERHASPLSLKTI
jgi:hypothetical protein